MRFLCVECDEAMDLTGTRGPDDGAMTVVFGCPSCGCEVAMLTNPMETQMVRSLGVKIGGRTVPAEPMEQLRSSLATPQAQVVEAPVPSAKPAMPSGSKCPFTGMVNDAFATENELRWTPEAEARLERIPSFARSMVRKSVEAHARENGYAEIDDSVIDEVRGHMGM